MSAADERATIRSKLANLTIADLVQRQYLVGLVQRIDTELLAMATLFGAGDEPLKLEPPPDARLTMLSHMFQSEIRRRWSATTTEEGETHANHEQNGNH